MSKFKPGLGRGLDALINPGNNEENNETEKISSEEMRSDDGKSFDILAKIDTSQIEPNPYQPREDFAPEALDELKKSILQNGLIQPITVRRGPNGNYQLISGERRLRACRDIGYKEIPAYIIKVETKEAMVALALIENIQREKLNAIEVAQAYYRLMSECNLSQEEIAERVGKDRSTVTNTIRLLKLPHEIQDALIKSEISAGHARALINLNSAKEQLDIMNKIMSEGLSVRKVEGLVRNLLHQPQKLVKPKSSSPVSENSVYKNDIENKLRRIFATKVICKHRKDGSGELVIEYYSNDDLERFFDLFDKIEKNGY